MDHEETRLPTMQLLSSFGQVAFLEIGRPSSVFSNGLDIFLDDIGGQEPV